ncbi:cytochrome P450 2D18 [Aspergillus sclerotioniger CBS 115572]|uniref:Cytochrome P450 2D18 n=1 Tax=Aspergillus sclerotioniger CBS 115572 TaxID=1450535 RepID=A0A317VUH9_9EURO|nr:cytochrome P450 2D18 [Aspergillus sclerotioniger CBS 115572]PWY76508.1 cytochrome P450 2D18 [Aspergillus sclerotioniger CBS 115572]
MRGTFPGSRGRGLPPGPPCIPLIGNVLQLPTTGIHLKFTEWAKAYGPIFSLKIGSSTTVVINSPPLVKHILDKQSAIYSHRPNIYIARELILRGDHMMFLNLGDAWRRGRRLYHQQFNETRCEKQHVILQNAEAIQMLRDFCLSPEALMSHPKRYSNSIMMSIVLGIRTMTPDTAHMRGLYHFLEGLSEILEIGATPPVDIFPIFKYLPESWFHNWKSRSRAVGALLTRLYEPLIDHVIRRRNRVGSKECFLDNVLDQQEKLGLSDRDILLMVGNLLEGGSDTTASMLLIFIQAMLKYPDIQTQVQAQIDSVVGEDRSPTWDDYARLPMVAMVVKECLRWRPVAPTAFPHAAKEDGEIDGMRIPKGSTVVLNVWGLHHDPDRHADPDIFNPWRYADRTLPAPCYASSPDYENRDHYAYGAGRRICPGIQLAERGLFIGIAKMLWAFEISEPVDPQTGRPIPVDVDPVTGYLEGFLNCPKDFQATVRVRSQRRRKTIFREFDAAEQEVFRHYECL